MIVVDTNTIAYLFIPGDHTQQARQALKKDNEWSAPLLWRSEFQNILASYLRQKLLTLSLALQMMREAENLMHGGEYEVASVKVLDLALTSGCSAYDCEFIALGKDLDVPVITSDKRLLKAFPADTVSLEDFVN